MLRPRPLRLEELHHAPAVTRAAAQRVCFSSLILLILLRICRRQTTPDCQQMSEHVREAEVDLLIAAALVAAFVPYHCPIGPEREVGAARKAKAEAGRRDVLPLNLAG